MDIVTIHSANSWRADSFLFLIAHTTAAHAGAVLTASSAMSQTCVVIEMLSQYGNDGLPGLEQYISERMCYGIPLKYILCQVVKGQLPI